GVGYPAAPEQSLPTQTAPVYGGEQPGQYAAPQYPPPGAQFGPGGVGPGPGPNMPPVYGYGGYPPGRPTTTSTVAIVALCLFWLPLVGLVLAIIGLVKTARG